MNYDVQIPPPPPIGREDAFRIVLFELKARLRHIEALIPLLEKLSGPPPKQEVKP